jgi:methylmalonyl-CoA mutase
MEEVEGLGGMAAAVATGMPKARIEETAARRQALIDNGQTVIVGVNKYRPEGEAEIAFRQIDNDAVRLAQTAQLAALRRDRDETATQAALAALTDAAKSDGNLLAAAVTAARARATVGEITQAMELVFGRHQARVETLSGVYAATTAADPAFAAVRADVAALTAQKGSAPRMFVVKMGQDGHDRGAKVIASAFGDAGFEVGVSDLFMTPDEAADAAIAARAEVVGISSQAAGHMTLAPQLVRALKARGADDIIVVCGGVIPPQDYNILKQHGIRAIFGPGTPIPQAAGEILTLLRQAKGF